MARSQDTGARSLDYLPPDSGGFVQPLRELLLEVTGTARPECGRVVARTGGNPLCRACLSRSSGCERHCRFG